VVATSSDNNTTTMATATTTSTSDLSTLTTKNMCLHTRKTQVNTARATKKIPVLKPTEINKGSPTVATKNR
jgi:hypothetical protein